MCWLSLLVYYFYTCKEWCRKCYVKVKKLMSNLVFIRFEDTGCNKVVFGMISDICGLILI